MRERLMAENRQKYQKVKKVGSRMPSYVYLVHVKVYYWLQIWHTVPLTNRSCLLLKKVRTLFR